MIFRKLRIVERLRAKVDEAIHRLLRPHVGRIIERMMTEEYACDEEADADIPDCEECEHRDDCPWDGPLPVFLEVQPFAPPPDPDVN